MSRIPFQACRSVSCPGSHGFCKTHPGEIPECAPVEGQRVLFPVLGSMPFFGRALQKAARSLLALRLSTCMIRCLRHDFAACAGAPVSAAAIADELSCSAFRVEKLR